MSHFDFDVHFDTIRKQRSCTLLGKRYTDLPDLPFTLGERLLFIRKEENPEEVFRLVVDFVLGEGEFDGLIAAGMSDNQLGDFLAWVRGGYQDQAITERQEELAKKLEALAEQMAEVLRSTSSPNTGDSSTPILSASTGSDLTDPATSAGASSSGSSAD